MDRIELLGIGEPIRGNAEPPRGVVALVRDLQVDDKVRREGDEYLSMVSDELRTPLGHIKGYATTLLVPGSTWDAAMIRHCLEIIVEAVDELEGLIDSFLEMSLIGARLLEVELEPRPLESLAATAIERLHERLIRHSVVVHVP